MKWSSKLSIFHPRRKWLRVTGSPQSRIDRCEFKNEKNISVLEFSDFDIRKMKP